MNFELLSSDLRCLILKAKKCLSFGDVSIKMSSKIRKIFTINSLYLQIVAYLSNYCY